MLIPGESGRNKFIKEMISLVNIRKHSSTNKPKLISSKISNNNCSELFASIKDTNFNVDQLKIFVTEGIVWYQYYSIQNKKS